MHELNPRLTTAFRQSYDPQASAETVIGNLLQRALPILGCQELVWQEDRSSLAIRAAVDAPLSDYPAHLHADVRVATARRPRQHPHNDHDLVIDCVYGQQALGQLICRSNRRWRQQIVVACEHLANRLSCLVQRDRLTNLLRQHFGTRQRIIGTSEPLAEIEENLHRAARVHMPVIIQGEVGTQKSLFAGSIHLGHRGDRAPFVEIICNALPEDRFELILEQAFEQAHGGTLYLNGIDELHHAGQERLPRLLESGIAQWLGRVPHESRAKPRIVASTTAILKDLVETGQFSPVILRTLHYLQITAPPLRTRTEDIPYLVTHLLTNDQGADAPRADDSVLHHLSQYPWPENLLELEQTLADLAANVDEPLIRLDHLRHFAPQLFRNTESQASNKSQVIATIDQANTNKPVPLRSGNKMERLSRIADNLLRGDFSEYSQLHDSLQRALRYLSQHYQEDFTLGHLANQAFVSPSHLSFLMKSNLGISFKPLLGYLRIEKAKELLARGEPKRITDISLDVGFGDLSHFEKMFKRYVQLNPREFRRQMLAKRSLPRRTRVENP